MAGTTNTSRRIGAALAVAVTTCLAPALVPAASAAGQVVASKQVAKPAAEVRDFWTRARIRAAVPADVSLPDGERAPAIAAPPPRGAAPSYVPPADPGPGASAGLRSGTVAASRLPLPDSGNRDRIEEPGERPYRAHGKVFFTIDGTAYVCSGTAVNSRNRSVVWTAGHCVFDAGPRDEGYTNRFVKNFMFRPAYENGVAPYGSWVAKRLATTGKWKRRTNLSFDVGAAVVGRVGGKRLQRVVGARGIGFDQSRNQLLEAFGYPAGAPFDGEYEYRCTGRPEGSDDPPGTGPATHRLRCDMTGGSSGGGWTAGGTLLSVTSYGYTGEFTHLYGPYLSKAAKRLYKRVRGR